MLCLTVFMRQDYNAMRFNLHESYILFSESKAYLLFCGGVFRSLQAIPGLWLLSLSLSGARQRNGGSLSIPIGLRAGIMASSFILQKGGFFTYNCKGNFPLWIAGTLPFQPFSGLVGLVFSLSLAILLYPRQAPQNREAQK